MSTKRNGLVWVDHHEARVIHPLPEDGAVQRVRADDLLGHIFSSFCIGK